MQIFLDESGTFKIAPSTGSFCVVGAYVAPEHTMPAVKKTLRMFKRSINAASSSEIKRRNLSELQYLDLMHRLSQLDGIGVAVGTDSGMNHGAETHKENQASAIEAYIPNMIYPEGRDAVQNLAGDIRRLSDQNYVEMLCRTYVALDVIQLSTLYYSQRIPAALGSFNWKFDRKDLRLNHFEQTLGRMVGGLLQAISYDEPFEKLESGDYSHFSKFETTEMPAWLPAPKFDRLANVMFNLGAVWGNNLEFVDSDSSVGVQVADLLASGLRGILRGTFSDERAALEVIGSMLVQRNRSNPGMRLIRLGYSSNIVPRVVSQRIRRLDQVSRRMLVR